MTIETTYGEQRPIYFVIREGGRAPRHRHDSRFKAEKEAERLAIKTPGAVFHVVKLKKTVTNTSKPVVESDRQWELVGRLNEGDRCQIKPTHHEFASERGHIAKIELMGETPTVWVYLDSLKDKRRFSPSSIVATEEPAVHPIAPDREPAKIESAMGRMYRPLRSGDLVDFDKNGEKRSGEVEKVVDRKGEKPDYLVRDIIENVIVQTPFSGDALTLITRVEDRPELVRHAFAKPDEAPDENLLRLFKALAPRFFSRRSDLLPPPVPPIDSFPGRYIPAGEDVWIIAQKGIGDIPGAALKGKLVGHDSDRDFVWVDIEGKEDNPTKVNASRVYHHDDSRIRVVPI